ncbi:MAG: hypothetical protein K0U39_09620 [Alphaproteobacteria bacterium]|nr:hypothetical protein [Alphaproteobacteria bacterium]
MWNIFSPVCSRKNNIRRNHSSNIAPFIVLLIARLNIAQLNIATLILPKMLVIISIFSLHCVSIAYAQSISSDELLLDPRDLPTYERQINLAWKPIRDKIATLGDPKYTGQPQAALVNIYIENNSWQLAWEYAQNIRVPVWRAHALLLIAENQRKQGINTLSNRMLNSALTLLRPVHEENTVPEIFSQAAKAIYVMGDITTLQQFFELVMGKENLLLMARDIYPLLQDTQRDIVLDSLTRLSLRFEKQYDEESFRLFIDMAKLGRDLQIDELHRTSLANAYAVSVERGRRDKLRDVLLEELAGNLIFSGQNRLALQVTAQIQNRIIQSRLYATAGRVQAQLTKNIENGSPLLGLADNSLLLIDSDASNRRGEKIDKKLQQEQVEHARSWTLIEKAQAGLINDAIRDAERIKDDYQKQRALTLIGLVLAEQEDYDALADLLPKVDYANFRLSLHLGMVDSLDDDKDAITDLLLEGLASENFYAPDSGYSPLILSAVLQMQIEKGALRRNDELFNLVQNRITQYLDGFDSIFANVEYFYYFAKRSRLKASYAETEITAILSSLWPYTKHPQYGDLMNRIMRYYLENNHPEQAFNVASGLGEDLNEVKFAILADIAAYASNEGDEVLTLRVINQIDDIDMQIDVLTDAIGNLAKSREVQRF